MTIRSGSAEWHGNVESGSGTVTVGDGVFEGAYSLLLLVTLLMFGSVSD
jgi:hypothetical protein